MPFKLSAYSIALLLAICYVPTAFAASDPPLDIIELLGEIEEDDLLEAALSELAQTQPKQVSIAKRNQKQNDNITAPVGDHKK